MAICAENVINEPSNVNVLGMGIFMKILMLDTMTYGEDISIKQFNDIGEVTAFPSSTRQEALSRMAEMNPEIVVINKILADEKFFLAAPKLKMVAITATGYNNIDIQYAKKHGIRVANVAGYSTQSVVQHTFALAFYLLEKMNYYDTYVKSEKYVHCPVFSHFSNVFYELNGKTWGIVGLGNIGRSVAAVAKAFGCKVVYYSASGNNYDTEFERLELDAFLAEADIISIHAPLNDKTNNLFNYDTIKKMKASAILLNLGRGPIVHDGDLARALEEGIISGAGLDVLSVEPIEASNPLLRIKDSNKLVITPHIAWATYEARTRLLDEVFKNIEAFIHGKERNVIV